MAAIAWPPNAAAQQGRRDRPQLSADSIAILDAMAVAIIDGASRIADSTTGDAPQRARTRAALAVALAEAAGDPAIRARVWRSRAFVYDRLRLRDSATAANEQAVLAAQSAVDAASNSGDPVSEARARVAAAELVKFANYNLSKAQYAQAFRLFESAGAWSEAAEAIHELGYQWNVGKDSSAKIELREASLNQKAAVAKARIDSLMANGYKADDDHPTDALRWFREAANAARLVSDARSELYALRNAIEVYRRVADSGLDDSGLTATAARDSLESLLGKAVRIARRDPWYAGTFGNVADVYKSAGRVDSVVAYLRRALDAYTAKLDTHNASQMLPRLARAFLDKKQLDSALAYGRAARRPAAPDDSVPSEDVEVTLARTFESLGQHDSAAVAYSRSAAKAFNPYQRLSAAATQFMAAELPDSTAAVYERLRRMGRRDNDAATIDAGAKGLARLYQELGQPDRAADQYREVIRSTEQRKDAAGQARALLALAQFYHEEGFADSVRAIVPRAVATFPARENADRTARLAYCVFLTDAMTLLRREFREEESRTYLPIASTCLASVR